MNGYELVCDGLIRDIIMVEAQRLEEVLKGLHNNGCSCGNKNLEWFTLIYGENKFKYVLCECCKNKIYVDGVVYGIC